MSALDRLRDSTGNIGSNRVIAYDAVFGRDTLKLHPGDYGATGLDLVFNTVLGSCISACLYDPVARVGGMNHFLLPGSTTGYQGGRYGMHAMELLINEMLKRGAAKNRMLAKVFGGAKVLKSMGQSDVGARNADFIETYLEQESIPIVASDLRSDRPRKVIFFASTGQAMVRNVGGSTDSTDWQDELEYAASIGKENSPPAGEVELF